MGQSLLQLARDELGVSRLSELRDSQLRSDEVGERVVAAYTRWTDAPSPPPEKPADELRPVIATFGISTTDEVVALSRALLLCESAALIVPDTMSYLYPLVRMLLLLEPAIEDGLVVLVPEQAISDHTSYLASWWQEQLGPTRLRPPETEQEKLERAEQLVIGSEIALALDACIRFPDRLDLASTRPEQTALLRRWLADIEETTRIRETVDRLRYLPELLSLPLPQFKLPLEDLAAVRRSGVFGEWRAALSAALHEVRQIDDDHLLAGDQTRLDEIRAHLLAASRESVEEAKRSRVLRAAYTGSAGLAIACVTGALGAGGAVAGAGAAAAAFGASQFVSWLGGRPGAGTRAFRRLVVHLFPDTKSAPS